MEGRTAQVFDRGDGTVLKLFRPGFPRRAVDGEEAIARAMAGCPDVPCPRFVGRVEQDGRAGLIYERVDGAPQLAALARSPLSVMRQARLAADLHARIHRARAPGLPDQREALVAALDRAPDLDGGVRGRLAERVRAWPSADALCHGDFHPENILLAPDGPVVIDWMTATAGRPIVDVARTAVILRFAETPPHLSVGARIAVTAVRRVYLRAYLRAYARASGSSLAGLGEVMAPLAAARLAENRPDGERRRLRAFVGRHAAS